jgi:hypothetical protein
MFKQKLFFVVWILDLRISSECQVRKGFGFSALIQYKAHGSASYGVLVEGFFFYGWWKYMRGQLHP